MANPPEAAGIVVMSEERDILLRAQLREAALYWNTPPMTLEGICAQVHAFITSYNNDVDRSALWLAMLDNYRWILQSIPELYLLSLRSMRNRANRQTLHRCWDANDYCPVQADPYEALKEMANLLLAGEYDHLVQINALGRMCRAVPLTDWPSIGATQAVTHILMSLPIGQRFRCLGAIAGSFTAQVELDAPAHTDEQTTAMLLPLVDTNPREYDSMMNAVFMNWPQVESALPLSGARIWDIGFRMDKMEQSIQMHNNRILFARHRRKISDIKDQREFLAFDVKIATHPEGHEQAGDPIDPLDAARTCVLCMDNKRCITFASCGHFVCCANCTVECKVCPVCRVPITRRIYTYLA